MLGGSDRLGATVLYQCRTFIDSQLVSRFLTAVWLPILELPWVPSCPNRIKIDMDDSFSSSMGASGIGGVFRDHLGTVLLHFAKHVEADSTINVEILVIREGIFIAVASRWSGSVPFEIESDSANTVFWFTNPPSVL